MPKISKIAFLAALCALGLPTAFGQSPTPAPGATPFESRSAFDGYRPFGQEEVQPWKQTNDTVREVGGWRAYAREMRESSQVPAGPRGTAEPQNPEDPHAGHGKP